jgi:hypothetical protein
VACHLPTFSLTIFIIEIYWGVVMKRRNIIIGCVALLVVICVGVAAFAYFGTRALTQSPYPIASRPMPTGTDIATLLPAKVGDFIRSDVSDGGADYSDRQSQISITVSIKNSPAEAQASVKAAASTAYGSTGSLLGVDPSFLRQVSGGNARFLYTRGAYLFDVQTTSSEALDKFMNAFAY